MGGEKPEMIFLFVVTSHEVFFNHLAMARCPVCQVRTVYDDICVICRRKQRLFEASKENERVKKFQK